MIAMRWIAISIFMLAFAVSAMAKDESVDELKGRLASARPEDRPGLCVHIAQDQLRAADKFYDDGKADQARAAVADIVEYSEKARDAALASHTHLKNVEIAVRKMSVRLNDIRRSLAFEDQAPVADAVKRLEDIRTSLLDAMFKKEKK